MLPTNLEARLKEMEEGIDVFSKKGIGLGTKDFIDYLEKVNSEEIVIEDADFLILEKARNGMMTYEQIYPKSLTANDWYATGLLLEIDAKKKENPVEQVYLMKAAAIAYGEGKKYELALQLLSKARTITSTDVAYWENVITDIDKDERYICSLKDGKLYHEASAQD